MASRENDADLKDRVGRLMQFLREMVKARTRPVLRVEDHERVQWLFPGSAPFQVEHSATAGEVVVQAPRVHLEDPPALPPRSLEPWVADTDLIDRSDTAGPQFHEPNRRTLRRHLRLRVLARSITGGIKTGRCGPRQIGSVDPPNLSSIRP